MRTLSVALLLLVATPALAGDAKTKTKINSPAAAKRLLAAKQIRIQWIETKPGALTVENEGGRYHVRGEQRDEKGNFLTIDGTVTAIDERTFEFDGKIVTRVDYIAEGKACPRSGRMTFRISGKRKYWRLKQNRNPCSEVTDYVDVLFTTGK